LALGLGLLIKAALPKRYESGFEINAFASLPVQANGRIKPLDTIARDNLLRISGKQSLKLPNGSRMDAATWMMEVALRPDVADQLPVFRIDNADILGLWGEAQESKKYFSFLELKPHFEVINQQAEQINNDSENQTVFEKKVVELHESLTQYHILIHSFHPITRTGIELEHEYAFWVDCIGPGLDAIQSQQEGKPFDQEAMNRFALLADRYLELAKLAQIGIVPAPKNVAHPKPLSEAVLDESGRAQGFGETQAYTEIGASRKDEARGQSRQKKGFGDWNNVGQSLMDVILTRHLDPSVLGYAKLLVAYNAGDAEEFNQTLTLMQERFKGEVNPLRLKLEYAFNQFQPFYQSLQLYVLVTVLIFFSWLGFSRPLQKSAYWLLLLSFFVHTAGLLIRMYLQERPPVTNLYSSAIFVGWAAVLLGILMERTYRNGLGCAVSGIIGFSTLIIAQNLGASGDTLEMMRAVLDSNFWLSTHVITVTLGYSAMFLAGALALIYVVRGVLTASLDKETARSLARMVYGTICFATLFSFVGTMLGGVWADQSWGRFWGWDPKENGALIIVLWCAIVIHARWGKLFGERGLMIAALFGNIITSWSWFGTNMLGVGLHNYGFMDRAFYALAFFIASQVILMAISLLPLHYWRSGKQLS